MPRYSPKQLRAGVKPRPPYVPPVLENRAVIEPVPVEKQREQLLTTWDTLEPPYQQIVLNVAVSFERESKRRKNPPKPMVETSITPRGTIKTTYRKAKK
jgi:hypothetical protein